MFVCCSISVQEEFCSFLGVRSEIIYPILGTPKSPNIFARVIVSTNSNCYLIAICNKYCHLRSCFAYSCNPSTFRLYALKLHLFPPFQLCMQNATICNSKVAIHEETSSFFKFCLYVPNVKFWRYIQENTRFS